MKELDLQDKCNTLGRHNYNLARLAQDGSDTVYRTIVNNKNKLIELQNVILHMPLPTNLTRCQAHNDKPGYEGTCKKNTNCES